MIERFQPSIVTGILAGLTVATGFLAGIPAWVAFLVWTTHGFLQENGIGWLGAAVSFAIGLGVAIAATAAGQAVSSAGAEINLAFAVGGACALVVFVGTFFTPRPVASAIFVGMIAWFGSRSTDVAPSTFSLLAACALGLVSHFLASRCTRRETTLRTASHTMAQ